MESPEAALEILVALQDLGVRLALDDFGTGYSSLSYLHRFPFNTLKIDRSFISRLGQPGEQLDIVQTIVTLAHIMKMDLVAEGIEDLAQWELLQSLGCQYGQGYFFARPLSASDALDRVREPNFR
jgi:EAL domain-containing protein (putative c-di-GMP-specific phosphodiesterase class I)